MAKTKNANSGGKKKKKNVIKFKNILAQPIPQYWPEISETDVEDLKRILSDIKSSAIGKVDLKEIGIILGMNACLRKLKAGQISSLLISTEIKPKFIVKQIICMTISNYPKTKLLCVPGLKTITEEMLSIPSLLVATYKHKAPFFEEWVLKKCENYPMPEEFAQYYGNREENSGKSKTIEQRKSLVEQKKAEKVKDQNDWYLMRPSIRSKRAFIPENAKNIKPLNFEIQNKQSASSSWSDYISFSGETMQMTNKNANSDEECEIDKKRLLNIFERMNPTTTKVNENNSEVDVKMKEIHKDSEHIEECVEESTKESAQPVDVNLIKKKKRRRKRNSISVSDSNEKQLQHMQPAFKYISLNVNKIQGNSNRKKKKNKNKK